ncbi:MAG: hypothetical protein Q9173_006487 [Seirophora scorigena]
MANLRAASSLEGLDRAVERSGWESGAGHGYDDDAVLSKATHIRQAIRLLRPHGVQHFGAHHARRLFGQSILQCVDDSPAHGRDRACGLVSSRQRARYAKYLTAPPRHRPLSTDFDPLKRTGLFSSEQALPSVDIVLRDYYRRTATGPCEALVTFSSDLITSIPTSVHVDG